MKKQFRPLVLCLTLFCGVMSHSIMGALPPTPIQLAGPFLKDGPTYARFTELNDRLKTENKPKAMPYSNDAQDLYNSDGMPYANFFQKANFEPTKEQWEKCAKRTQAENSGYNYYPFSADRCAIVVKKPIVGKPNEFSYALNDPDGKTLVSAGMQAVLQPAMVTTGNQ
jgi:hypothetical protein